MEGLFGISYLLLPCENATIVPELPFSWRRAAAIVNSGTRRSSAAARSKLASFSRSSLSSPEVVKHNDWCDMIKSAVDRPSSAILDYIFL